jgi:hypothetical protein
MPTDADGMPPEPGDLFVLAATADLPVEWAILDRRAGKAAGELLAVPADTRPLAGGADVEVPAELSGGPLSLRCRFGVWLAAGLFEPKLRSGALTPDIVAEALQRFRRLESGDLEASPLAEEVDADPEYADWIREVPERARALAAAARPVPWPAARPAPAASWTSAYRLAAMFALLAFGLSIWVVLLRREVGQLSAPIFDIPASEVVLGAGDRGGSVLEIPRGASHVLLLLVVNAGIAPGEGRFEIVDAGGRAVWQSPRVHLIPAGEFRLIVPRRLLPDGVYSVRIVPDAGGRPIAEKTVKIVTSE